MATAAIIGSSGYSGQETLDRVLRHPELEVIALGSDSLAGESASALDLRLNGSLPAFVANEDALAAGADVIFLCVSNERSAAIEPPADTIVVDLSGAHRIADWSYAIPELYPPEGKLIANPGCYATAALLALAPIANAIDPTSVVVDGKSGV
ncbi:MAG TPA: hypothetical protein VLE97_11865, partial [Gaiellaceae bacterium]|nr:hypothetical protein [Gaiellaceae bacterium]